MYQIKDLNLDYIKLLQFNSKKNNSIKKWAKNLNRHIFKKEDERSQSQKTTYYMIPFI